MVVINNLLNSFFWRVCQLARIIRRVIQILNIISEIARVSQSILEFKLNKSRSCFKREEENSIILDKASTNDTHPLEEKTKNSIEISKVIIQVGFL